MLITSGASEFLIFMPTLGLDQGLPFHNTIVQREFTHIVIRQYYIFGVQNSQNDRQ